MPYTPSPIDDMLAGRVLDALVAEKVMGWHKETRAVGIRISATEADYDWWVNETGEKERMVRGWRPTITVAQAFQVQAALEKKSRRVVYGEEAEEGYWLKLTSPFDPSSDDSNLRLWWAGFTPHGFTGWNRRPDWQAPGDTAELAICRAAVKVRMEEPTL